MPRRGRLLRGDLAAAERFAERAFQIGQEAGEPDAILIYGIQLSFVIRAQGRGQEIIAMIEQTGKRLARHRVPPRRPRLDPVLA